MRVLHAILRNPEDIVDEDEEEFDEDGLLIAYDEEESPTIYEFEEEDEEFDEEDELLLDDVKTAIVQAGTIPIAIIGRPNVGKSTFINQVSHKELSKVSAIPGTTLDYISSEISVKEQDYILYDTAGIRRKGSIHGLEKIAFEKTYGMLKYYQPVVLFLISGDEGVTKTDRALMTHILDLHIPILVVINKIDTLNNLQKEKLLKAVEEHFGHKDRLFTIGISAKTGFNINKIRPIVNDLRARSHVALTTGQLNKTISRAFIAKPPTFPHNKVVKVYYTTQVKSYPPIFMCFINKKPNVTTAFKNWLESVVRKAGGWQGIPLHFLFKDKKMDEDGYAKHLEKRKQAIRARLKRTPKEKIEAKKKAIARAEQKRGM
jgi:GTPase